MFRASVLLTRRWPLLGAPSLALTRVGLLATPKNIDHAHTARFRESVVEHVADLALAGHARPVLEYVHGHARAWDLQLLRRFLTRMVHGMVPGAAANGAPTLSLDFAFSLTQLVALAQARLKAAVAGSDAASAAGGSAGAAGRDASGGASLMVDNQRKALTDFLAGAYAVFDATGKRLPALLDLLVAIHNTAKEHRVL
jgi:hypothetical protein